MKLHKIDLIAILSRIAGLGILASDATFQSSITALGGKHAPQIIAGVGLASVLATDILRVVGSPTPVTAPEVKQ